MAIKLPDVGHSSFKVVSEGIKYCGDIRTAYTEKKWWRLIALVILMSVMIATGFLVKPLFIAFFAHWFIGTWGFSLPVSKFVATGVAMLITTQVGKFLKYWVLKINK
jgi:hypothetical protein